MAVTNIPYCLFGPASTGVVVAVVGTGRYAEPIDLSHRYDIRTIGELASDDDQELSRGATMAHENVIMSLNDASGRVEAALRHGGRYSIENLVDDLTDNSRNHLKSIVCTIAMTRLLRRKPGTFTDLLAQLAAEAEEHLKHLSSGYDVFTIEAHAAAGIIKDGGNTNEEDISMLTQRNLISDNMIGRAFPHRGDGSNRDRGSRFL